MLFFDVTYAILEMNIYMCKSVTLLGLPVIYLYLSTYNTGFCGIVLMTLIG